MSDIGKEISSYSKLMRLRNSAKKLQQLSWTVAKFEDKFDIDKLEEKEYEDLMAVYTHMIPHLKIILKELEQEL